MSNTLVINSSNVVSNGLNNTYQYRFKTGNFQIKEGSTITIGSCQIPYSFQNVTTAYNNQTFSITWTSGVTTTTYNITLPQGFYDVPTINTYIQQFCITNGLYLIDSNGNYVYYINLSYNQTYYGVQLISLLVPTSLPAGYTQPGNFAGYPSVSKCMGFNVLSSNNFGLLIGFNAGNYGNTTSSISKLSDFTPLGSNINSIILRCNLVDNNITTPSDILDSFVVSGDYGSNINYNPNFEKRVKLKSGSYSNLILTLCDQNFNLITALDSNVCITLLLNEPK